MIADKFYTCQVVVYIQKHKTILEGVDEGRWGEMGQIPQTH